MTIFVWIVFILAIVWLCIGAYVTYTVVNQSALQQALWHMERKRYELTGKGLLYCILIPFLICAGCISYLFGGWQLGCSLYNTL